jgi:hypothetical protein
MKNKSGMRVRPAITDALALLDFVVTLGCATATAATLARGA